MIAKTLPLRRPLRISTLLELLAEWLKARAEALEARRRYALDRRLLGEMNNHALSDIGIGRDEIGRLTVAGDSSAAPRTGR